MGGAQITVLSRRGTTSVSQYCSVRKEAWLQIEQGFGQIKGKQQQKHKQLNIYIHGKNTNKIKWTNTNAVSREKYNLRGKYKYNINEKYGYKF